MVISVITTIDPSPFQRSEVTTLIPRGFNRISGSNSVVLMSGECPTIEPLLDTLPHPSSAAPRSAGSFSASTPGVRSSGAPKSTISRLFVAALSSGVKQWSRSEPQVLPYPGFKRYPLKFLGFTRKVSGGSFMSHAISSFRTAPRQTAGPSPAPRPSVLPPTLDSKGKHARPE